MTAKTPPETLPEAISDAPIESSTSMRVADNFAVQEIEEEVTEPGQTKRTGKFLTYFEGDVPRKVDQVKALLEDFEFFHDETNSGFILVPVAASKHAIEHVETIEVPSRQFRAWLLEHLGKLGYGTISQEVSNTVAEDILGRAIRGNKYRDTFKRVGGIAGKTSDLDKVYLDLCSNKWNFVEIDRDGWRLKNGQQINFTRPDGMQPLKPPKHYLEGYSLKEDDVSYNSKEVWERFRELLGCESDHNFILMVSWMIGCLFPPSAPYIALAIGGESDSGKSNTARMLRDIFDPHAISLDRAPDDVRNLVQIAQTRFVMGMDNLSKIPNEIGDVLCQIATNGTFSERTMGTNKEVTMVYAKRPILITGIVPFMGRPDWKRRCLHVELPARTNKRGETTIWREYRELQPYVLGALCDCVSGAIRNIMKVTDDQALGGGNIDFARRIMAAELSGAVPWERGQFKEAYIGNRNETLAKDLDSEFPQAVVRLTRSQAVEDKSGRCIFKVRPDKFLMMVTEEAAQQRLGKKLDIIFGDERERRLDREIANIKKTPNWPNDINSLGLQLSRLKGVLREAGKVEFDNSRRDAGGKVWQFILLDDFVEKDVFDDEEEEE